MEKKAVSEIMLPLLLVSMLTLAFNIKPVKSEHELGETSFTWEVYYPADEPPDESEPPWTLNKGILSECASVSDGVLRLDTTSGNGYWYYRRNWEASSLIGATIEARLKVEKSLYEGQLELNIADGAHAAMVEFYVDRVNLFNVGEYFMDTTDDFHVYRVIVQENDIFLYVDDFLVLDGTGKFDYPTIENRVLFGDSSYGAGVLEGAISYWDYIAYTAEGAFPLPRTWTVDDDGGADFTKIQDAIDAADPWDTVFVYSGTYYEHLNVDKNYLKIIGENRETTIIDGGSQDFATAVEIAGNNTLLRGFTITVIGMDSRHILVSETVDTVIADNNITGRDYGIRVNDSTNITISGNSMTGCYWSIILFNSSNASITENIMEKRIYRHSGILLYNSFNNVVAVNNMTEMTGFCIDLRGSSNNTIVGNTMTGAWNDISKRYDGGGISMQASSIEKCSTYNIFSDNDIRNVSYAVSTLVYEGVDGHHDNVFLRNNITNSAGIYLMNSYDFTFKENTFSENHYNIGIYGDDLPHYIHDIDTSNTLNGKRVYYLVNQQNLRMDPSSFPDIGYLALINSTNITVENLDLREKNQQGLLMAHTSNSTIINNDIRNNSIGISLDILSSNNTVSENSLSENIDGVLLEYSFNNSLTHNNASNNVRGFYLKGSWNNTLAYNVIENNTRGGVWLDYSINNTIVCNHIANNQATEISDAGVSLYRSYINRIFHNNFINNERQAYTCMGNFWDDGYPSGGNYWSDFEDRYPDAQELDGSGIWDTRYSIDENNQDYYPLMEPWSPTPHVPTTIDELKTKIEELGSEDEIDNRGTVKSLIAKLNVAQKLMDKEKTDEVIMVLEDFITQVQELSGIHITAEAADILIESAEYIISHL